MGDVKITSDGTREGTRVVDTETGKVLTNVEKVSWSIDAEEGVARATLVLWPYYGGEVVTELATVVGVDVLVRCLHCGHENPQRADRCESPDCQRRIG